MVETRLLWLVHSRSAEQRHDINSGGWLTHQDSLNTIGGRPVGTRFTLPLGVSRIKVPKGAQAESTIF